VPLHVQIYDNTGQNYFGSYPFDLTDEQLEERILRPYRAGATLVVEGHVIPASEIKSIRIAETEQSAAELRPLAEARARTDGSFVGADGLIMSMGQDRTYDFIAGGPGSGDEPILEPMAVDRVVILCERFPRFARQLRQRRGAKAPLEIADEHDLQYLVGALLALHFDDVRREEWMPSFAGGSTRGDFLVKLEKVVLELKHTRDGLDDKKIGSELIVDIANYAGNQDCDSLVCFVFDPDQRIGNPAALIADLEARPPGNLQVRVVIQPR
jgi:hypothetical protein